MSRKVFMSLEAAFDNLALEDIDADLALILPDVDDLINKDELNDKDTATAFVCDVPDLVEVVNADKKMALTCHIRQQIQTLRLKSNGTKDQK